jgi:phosphoglycerate-specific signal transduction histidine kinase
VLICQDEIRKNVKALQIDIPENLPLVLTDPVAIEQVVVNLLINVTHASD